MSISMAVLILAQAAQPAIASPCGGEDAAGAPCAAAIAAARPAERSRLLYDRAFALNEQGDAAAALADLDKALAVDPANRAARRERAYSRDLLGDFAGARADLDHALALGGGNVVLFKERALALHGLGDVAGALADRTRVVEAAPDDAVALTDRAAEYLWLGRFGDAGADLDHAEKLARDDGARARVATLRTRLADWRDEAAPDAATACHAAGEARHYGAPHLVATCSAAFLAATAPTERAALLDVRARAFAAADDADSARADWQMAAAIDPGNARWQASLGFADVAAEQHQAARRAFDRALAAAPDDAAALAGRAAANYSLHATRAAYADARRSIALDANAAAYVVLGDIANDRHDSSAASDYWLQAYRLGERSEDLLVRLQDVGIDEPEDEVDNDRLPGADAPTV